MDVKKPVVRMNGTSLDPNWGKDGWKEEYPNLTDMLQCTQWDDRTNRQTSTLLLFVEDSVLKACLNDRHFQRSAFFTAETMEALIVKIELALTNDTAEWKSRGSRGQNGLATPF